MSERMKDGLVYCVLSGVMFGFTIMLFLMALTQGGPIWIAFVSLLLVAIVFAYSGYEMICEEIH